jgi:1,4-alpha-glucan branching enzyme
MALDPVHRKHHQGDITFSLVYAFDENFVLPLSHDEVVHGKGAMLTKMPGDRWQQLANLRACYGLMFTHPGKKLLFMGCEFAQPTEWHHDRALDWGLLDQPDHLGIQRLVRDLNLVYRGHAELHQLDTEGAGFAWLSHEDAAQSVLAFERRARDGSALVVVCNLTPVPRLRYRIGLPHPGPWRELLNTDQIVYGGSGMCSSAGPTELLPWQQRPQSLCLDLPPLSCIVMQPMT